MPAVSGLHLVENSEMFTGFEKAVYAQATLKMQECSLFTYLYKPPSNDIFVDRTFANYDLAFKTTFDL